MSLFRAFEPAEEVSIDVTGLLSFINSNLTSEERGIALVFQDKEAALHLKSLCLDNLHIIEQIPKPPPPLWTPRLPELNENDVISISRSQSKQDVFDRNCMLFKGTNADVVFLFGRVSDDCNQWMLENYVNAKITEFANTRCFQVYMYDEARNLQEFKERFEFRRKCRSTREYEEFCAQQYLSRQTQG